MAKKVIERGVTVQLNASIPKELIEHLKVLAEREERSLSNFVTLLLRRAVTEFEKKGGK